MGRLMAVFTDPAKMIAHMRRRAAVAVKDAAGFALWSAEKGYEDAFDGLSGKTSSEKLAAMGHPYGRGSSASQNYANAGNVLKRGRAPMLPINRQSGRLRASLNMRSAGRGRYDTGIGRGVEYARYILHPAGTVKMVGRGLMGWRKVNRAYPAGLIERRHRLRMAAARDVLRRSHKKTP